MSNDTIVNVNNKREFTNSLNSYFNEHLIQTKRKNTNNIHGCFYLKFKINYLGELTEISPIESLTNCLVTPEFITEYLKKAILLNNFWRNNSFINCHNYSFYLPVFYELGNKNRLCEKEQEWQISINHYNDGLFINLIPLYLKLSYTKKKLINVNVIPIRNLN